MEKFTCESCDKEFPEKDCQMTCDGMYLCHKCMKELRDSFDPDEKLQDCKSGPRKGTVRSSWNECVKACGNDKTMNCWSENCG